MIPASVWLQPTRDTVAPTERDHYDRVVQRQVSYGYTKGAPGYPIRKEGEEAGPYFGALLRSPVIADHISELGAFYRTRGEVAGSYSHKDREWVDIVLGSHLGFNMWGHILDGMAVGIRAEAVIAVLEHKEEDLDESERRFADIIRRFADGAIDAGSDWAFLTDSFGERGAIEYLAWIGHLTMTIRLIQAFIAPNAEPDPVVATKVRQFIESGQELPDPRARVPALD